jgi:hypothetical protein
MYRVGRHDDTQVIISDMGRYSVPRERDTGLNKSV